MELNEIISRLWPVVVSSSVLTALLTVTFQYVFKRLDYKNNYRKRVIEKRLAAYKHVDEIINEILYELNDQNGTWIGFFSDNNSFLEFMELLRKSLQEQVWLGKELIVAIKDLNHHLYENVYKARPQPVNPSDYQNIGDPKNIKLRPYVHRIQMAYLKDIKTIHKVDGFIKKRLKLLIRLGEE